MYVTCSVRERALRFIEREAGAQYVELARAGIPQRPFASLREVEPHIEQLVRTHSDGQRSGYPSTVG